MKNDIIIKEGEYYLNYSKIERISKSLALKYSFCKDPEYINFLVDRCTLYCLEKFRESKGLKHVFNLNWVLNTFLKTKNITDFKKHENGFRNNYDYDKFWHSEPIRSKYSIESEVEAKALMEKLIKEEPNIVNKTRSKSSDELVGKYTDFKYCFK